MTTTVQISLPLEQLELLNRVESLLLKNLEEANKTRWLTLSEACDRLKVKETKLREWIKYYQLPYYGMGEIKRFDANEIDEWFKKFSSKNPSEGLKIINKAESIKSTENKTK